MYIGAKNHSFTQLLLRTMLAITSDITENMGAMQQ